MAIDNSNQAINMAQAIVTASENLMTAFETLLNVAAQRGSMGLDLTTYDASYLLGEGIKHVDGVILNNILTSGATVHADMVTGNHDDIINLGRP